MVSDDDIARLNCERLILLRAVEDFQPMTAIELQCNRLGCVDPSASDLATKQLVHSIRLAVSSRLRLVDQEPRVVPKLPPTCDRDLTLGLEAKLNLELAEGDLDQRGANK